MALITRSGVICQFLKRFSDCSGVEKSVFDREIAQALAVLQVAVIVLGTFVLIELYDAILL